MVKAIETIEQIETDFAKRNPPFDQIEFPEERLLKEAGVTGIEDKTLYEKAKLLTAFSTFDYNRDANQLTDNLIELNETDPLALNTYHVTNKLSEDRLQSTFESIGFRYPSRDAHAWFTNCKILREEYNGDVKNLILETGCDAPRLVQQLNDDGFHVLKGDKVAPMYARFIDQYICELDNVWELDIPVDTHIRRLSKELFNYGEDYDVSDDRIRTDWRHIASGDGPKRYVVDGALWQIGNNWNEWGEDYWESLK